MTHGKPPRRGARRRRDAAPAPGTRPGLVGVAYTAPALAQRFRTIVFDTRGTGRSPVPDEPYGIPDLADDAASILDGRRCTRRRLLDGRLRRADARAHASRARALARPRRAPAPEARTRVPRPKHVRDAFESAMRLPAEEARRATLPYTFSPGWTEANPERFEEIVAASLVHPTSRTHDRSAHRGVLPLLRRGRRGRANRRAGAGDPRHRRPDRPDGERPRARAPAAERDATSSCRAAATT